MLMCDFPSLWWEPILCISDGLFNPLNTSAAVRLLCLWLFPADGELKGARYNCDVVETLFASESHTDDKCETNSSTKACSLLEISNMVGRSEGAFDEEIFEACDACVRRGSEEPEVAFLLSNFTCVQPTIQLGGWICMLYIIKVMYTVNPYKLGGEFITWSHGARISLKYGKIGQCLHTFETDVFLCTYVVHCTYSSLLPAFWRSWESLLSFWWLYTCRENQFNAKKCRLTL